MMTTSPGGVGLILAGLAAFTAGSPGSRAEQLPRAAFQHGLELSTSEGHVTLGWGGEGAGLVYELQSAAGPDFAEPTVEYQGWDEASFLSGLADGRYFLRVRARRPQEAAWGPWSDTVELVCEHHSLTLAWALFACGGVLFLLIVLFVGVNARFLERFESSDA